jgi:hypothetical protein
MSLLEPDDLEYRYRWSAGGDTQAMVAVRPDTLLDREDGHEVIAFIDQFCATYLGERVDKATAMKVERMLQAHPGMFRTHASLSKWIIDHWAEYF